jgi:HEAT repeat protein
VSPESHGALAAELQGRVDAGRLWDWQLRELGRVCAGIMRREADGAVRRDAAWLLARIGPETPADALSLMLHDRDPAVRASGIEAARRSGCLWGLGGAVRNCLSELVLRDRSELVRQRAIDVMRAMGEDGVRARSTILLALEDSSDGVRQRALYAIAEARDESDEALRAVRGRAADPSEEVRWAAAWALGRMAGHRAEAAGALGEALGDASPMVRMSAAVALAGIGMDQGRPVWVLSRLLGSALGDDDELVRGVAMDALRAIRG